MISEGKQVERLAIVEDGGILAQAQVVFSQLPFGWKYVFCPKGIVIRNLEIGKVENFDEPLENSCRQEVKEEMGIDVDIIRPMKTILARQTGNPNAYNILVHYLARRIGEIKPAENITEWGWFDINALPSDCAPNVIKIIQEYKESFM
ncbi:MAG: NUDIX domain-containing protein [Patescibacteria group bacterium]